MYPSPERAVKAMEALSRCETYRDRSSWVLAGQRALPVAATGLDRPLTAVLSKAKNCLRP
jgi:hypothetical protein